MKIFSASQIKAWDLATIAEQQISTDILMERAATACYDWILNHPFLYEQVFVFCGKGNNGGDGLALARLLLENNISVIVYILESGKPGTEAFQLNLHRLNLITKDIHFIQAEQFFPPIEQKALIIDALYGTGLNKPLEGLALSLVKHINLHKVPVISIDIPTGLFADKTTSDQTTIHASYTLSFQHPKLAFLMAENENSVGIFQLLDIGLSKNFLNDTRATVEMTDCSILKSFLKPRKNFSHKGNFGHAAIVAGSHGMIGASVLAAKACLHSGVGKLTCFVPGCGYEIMQQSVPEAMCMVSGINHVEPKSFSTKFQSIGIGPGIGLHDDTAAMLKTMMLVTDTAFVFDADALNLMATDKNLLNSIPAGSLITPHPKEFENLFGKCNNDFERLDKAIEQATRFNIYILLKGHYTAIITPRGKVYFNCTGNAGMAKAGMGDALTGIITGLLAQGYSLPEAALLSAFLHGAAADISAIKYSQQAMQVTDLITDLSEAWKNLVQ